MSCHQPLQSKLLFELVKVMIGLDFGPSNSNEINNFFGEEG
jgi:hypothetical protein